jgi:hypothetical protein
MAFELHISIPDHSPAGQAVQRLVSDEHVTPEQAVTRMLNEAVELRLVPTGKAVSDEEYLEQLRHRSAKRAEARRAAGDPMASIRPETPEALIGFLADAPEVAQTIPDMAYERRANSYGV